MKFSFFAPRIQLTPGWTRSAIPPTALALVNALVRTAWQEALRREAVIRPLAALPAIKRADLDDAASRLALAKTRITISLRVIARSP